MPFFGPVSGYEVGLIEDGFFGLLLLVWLVAVFSQNSLDHDPELCLHALLHGPIDCDVVADSLDEFPGYGSQCFVSEDFYCAVVRLQGGLRRLPLDPRCLVMRIRARSLGRSTMRGSRAVNSIVAELTFMENMK